VLERNLDLRIARLTVPEALSDLKGAYSGWDPTFDVNGTHQFYSSPGTYNSSINTITASANTENDSFGSSLSGTSPWGLQYKLEAVGISESYGTKAGIPFDSSSGTADITLRQHLLKDFWIDSTRLNIRVNKNRLKYTELGLKQTVMNIVSVVEQAYYDLIAARENVLVQEKAVELANRLVVENKKRVEVGALAPLDEKQAESQAATSEADLIAARATLDTQENNFKHLLTDDYAHWAKVSILPTASLAAPRQFFDRQLSWSKGLDQRPDLRQARLDLEKQGITLKYNYNQLFPQLDVLGRYGHNGGSGAEFSDTLGDISRGTFPTYYYGGELTFPLANTGARATYRRGKLELEGLKLTLKNLEQRIMTSIDNDIRQAESGYERVGATRAAREYATDALDAEQKKLESGKSTTYTVLQMQRDLTAARGAEIQALATYNKALAQLSLDEATILQRLGINVDVK
jgi:outer membrane protein TolC